MDWTSINNIITNDKVISGFIGLLAGLVGTAIGPWVKWGVEKRKLIYQSRRELINKWRSMTQKASELKTGEGGGFVNYLERHEDFYSIQPYLGQDQTSIYSPRTYIACSTVYPGVLKLIEVINKKEKEWGLV